MCGFRENLDEERTQLGLRDQTEASEGRVDCVVRAHGFRKYIDDIKTMRPRHLGLLNGCCVSQTLVNGERR